MVISATKKEPRTIELLPPGTREYVVAETEKLLEAAAARVKRADANLEKAKAELHKAQKAAMAAASEGERPGVKVVTEASIPAQQVVTAAGVKVKAAIVEAQQARRWQARLQLRLRRAKKGLSEIVAGINDEANTIVIGGSALKSKDSDAKWIGREARLLREAAAYRQRENTRQLERTMQEG